MSNLVAIPPGLHLSDALVSSPIVKVGRGSHNPKLLREATKKKTGKKVHNSCELWGGGQQILVCEPQKSAFFRANFPKKHAEINS